MITLATLYQATAQEVFDQVVQNLIRQGVRSETVSLTGKSTGCNYRTLQDDGTTLKCAAGWLIADSEYKPDMDDEEGGTDWNALIEKGYVPDNHQDLISELQYIHDTVQPLWWENAFQNYAYKNGLEYNTLPTKTMMYVKDEGLVYSDAE